MGRVTQSIELVKWFEKLGIEDVPCSSSRGSRACP